MVKLSRQAWNNVLIFSMLIMILLFNGLHRKVGSDEAVVTVPLLPEHSLLLTLQFEHTQVERIGQSWRANPDIAMDEAALTALMNVWLQYQLNVAANAHEAKVLVQGQMPQYYVVATLAGKSDGAVYAFYPQLERVLVHDHLQSRWLQMPIADLVKLFPFTVKEN